MRRARLVVLALVLLLATFWSCAALWFDGPASRPVAGLLAGGFAVRAVLLLCLARPRRRGLAAFCALFLVVLLCWLSLEASNERDWHRDVARPATAPSARHGHGMLGKIVTGRRIHYAEEACSHQASNERYDAR